MLDLQVLEGGGTGEQRSAKDEGAREQIVALRMPKRLVQLVDEQVAEMNRRYPGVRVTRSSIVRFAIHSLLASATNAAAAAAAAATPPPAAPQNAAAAG